MSQNVETGLCRIVNGIFDDAELDTGFFLSDEKVDIVCDWLDSYANALEKAWDRNGREGDEMCQKFAKVRSFRAAIECKRNELSLEEPIETKKGETDERTGDDA